MCYNTILLGFCGYNFEFDWFEAAPDNEEISFFGGTVGILKVGDEVGLGEISCNALNGVSEREDMDFGEIGDLSCWFDLYNVSKSDSKIFSDGFVHAYFRVI